MQNQMIKGDPLKVIVIGPHGVGKSSIMNRLCYGTFNPNNLATVGVEFESIDICVDDKKVQLQIWDTVL